MPDPARTKDKQEAALKPPWQCAAECAKRRFSKSESFFPPQFPWKYRTCLCLSLSFSLCSPRSCHPPSLLSSSTVLAGKPLPRVRLSFPDASLRCPLLLVHPFLCLPACYSFSSSSPIPARPPPHLLLLPLPSFVSQNPDFIFSPASPLCCRHVPRTPF